MTDRAIAWFRQQRSLQTDRPFFAYFALGDARSAPRGPRMVRQVQRPLRRGMGHLPARSLHVRKISGWFGPTPTSPPARTTSVPGTRCPMSSSPCWLDRWRCTQDSWSTSTMRRAGHRCLRGTRGPRRHADLLHHWRQRSERRGNPQWDLQRDLLAERRGCPGIAEFMSANIDKFGTPDAYNHYAVGWVPRCAPRTSGPSRWPRTSVVPVMARSCTGPTVRCQGRGS